MLSQLGQNTLQQLGRLWLPPGLEFASAVQVETHGRTLLDAEVPVLGQGLKVVQLASRRFIRKNGRLQSKLHFIIVISMPLSRLHSNSAEAMTDVAEDIKSCSGAL